MTFCRTRAAALLLSVLAACDGSTEPAALEIESVEIVPSPAEIPVGEKLQLQALIRDHLDNDVADAGRVFWSSEEPSIVSVSEQGLVTGHTAGRARVAASVAGVSGIASVIVVPPPVASVSVTPSDTSIGVGEDVTLSATPRAASGEVLSGRAVTWSSASPAAAEVDGNGRVTGLSTGAAVIRATIEGVVGFATVEVVGVDARRLEITPAAAAMVVGETLRFEVRAVDSNGNPAPIEGAEWLSSEPGIVRVSETGLATAVSPGAATLTATVGEASASVGVAVGIAPVATVEVVPDNLLLVAGDVGSLAAVLRAGDGTTISGRDVVWRSEDREVATVDADGQVVGVAPGETRVVASSEGKSGGARVVVLPGEVAAVVIDPPALTMSEGEVFTLAAEATAANGSPIPDAPIRWSSGDEDVATVNASGRVTALRPGSTTIAASSGGGSASATVRVVGAPAEILIVSGDEQSGRPGETLRNPLVVRVVDSAGQPVEGVAVRWSTNSGSIRPGSNSTSADGTAAAAWSVGGGLVRTASASVEGLRGVTFRAVYFDWGGGGEEDGDDDD